jgi:hypothetical protein
MTEAEMKTKLCPKTYDSKRECFRLKCFGSECAWWVWDKKTVTEPLPPGYSATWVIGGVPANIKTVYSETDGHCRLTR